MGFSMRVNFVDVICDDSLENLYIGDKKMGYCFDVRLSYYRGHFLSDITEFDLVVDNVLVKHQDIRFCLNNKEFNVDELKYLISEFWDLVTPAKIKIFKPNGLEPGSHKLEVKLMLRVPYLPLPGSDKEHDYMPLNSCGKKILYIKESGERYE